MHISMKVIDGINLQLMKNGHHIRRKVENTDRGSTTHYTTRQMHILQQDELSK